MFGIPPPTQDRFSMGWALMCICIWPKASHPGLYWPSERKGYHHTVDTRHQNPAVDNDKHIPFLYHGEKRRKTWYLIKHIYIYTSNRWCQNSSHKYQLFLGGIPFEKNGGRSSPHSALSDFGRSAGNPPSPQLAFGVRQQTIQDVELREPRKAGGGPWEFYSVLGKNALSEKRCDILKSMY